MKKIKSFIYLDNYKMYSISSQIFEGLTEYILKSETNSKIENDTQKGTLGSGRVLADIIESNSTSAEKRFLHDYGYTLFEDALLESGKVIQITNENIQTEIFKINDFSFIKVTNCVAFNDAKMIEELIGKFNEVGIAITTLSNKSHISEKNDINNIINNITDRNQKHKAKQIVNNLTSIKNIAKESGLQMDEEFLKQLKFLLNYGYSGQFEVQIPFFNDDENHLFSCILNRELLLENENDIIKKYFRETEKKFTVFGIITQTPEIRASLYTKITESVNSGGSNMK